MKRALPVLALGLVTALLTGCAPARQQPPCEPAEVAGDVIPDPLSRIAPYQLALSPDGAELAAQCVDGLCVWETATGRLVRRLPDGSHPAWSPDGTSIAVGGRDGTITLLDPVTGEARASLPGHAAPDRSTDSPTGISGLVFSPDGTRLASSGQDCTVKLWDLPGGSTAGSHPLAGPAATDLAFSPDGTRLAITSTSQELLLWDLPDGESTLVADSPPQGYRASWGAGGDRLVSTADDRAVLIDAASLKLLETAAETPVTEVAFAPDGETIALSLGGSAQVALWHPGSAAVLSAAQEHQQYGLVYSPDGATLYSGSSHGGVLAWPVADLSRPRVFELP